LKFLTGKLVFSVYQILLLDFLMFEKIYRIKKGTFEKKSLCEKNFKIKTLTIYFFYSLKTLLK
jgi:hypothetical protein